MRLAVRPTTLLLALVAAAPFAAAQDAHYWTYGYGPIGQLTEGTLVGGVSDLSAVFYNPGALALLDKPRFVVGLTSVELANIDVPGVAGEERERAGDDYTHDEALTADAGGARRRGAARLDRRGRRRAARWPTSTASRSPPGAAAPACRAPASPADGGIVVSFERMNAILEIDTENHVAVVQPGVTLDRARRGHRRRTASCTRCSPASTAPASAATSPPTPAACGR